jgi:hypothetical protein
MALFLWIVGRQGDFLIEFVDPAIATSIKGSRPESLPRHRPQTPYLSSEFLSGLLDSGAFIWRLDGAEPHGLLGDLVNVPARRLRWFRFLGHTPSIGRELGTFNRPAELTRRPPRRDVERCQRYRRSRLASGHGYLTLISRTRRTFLALGSQGWTDSQVPWRDCHASLGGRFLGTGAGERSFRGLRKHRACSRR